MSIVYSIKEYDSFTRNKEIHKDSYTALPEHTFDSLESFILVNKLNNGTDALEFMTISAKKGIGKVISAKNYVGIIVMNDGTTIEILPKVYSHNEASGILSKKLLLEMLKSLKDAPFRNMQTASMKTDRLPVFEVFIKMFVDELFCIIKRGLKCNYQSVQNNETFFKGKILFSDHIKHNHSHKEKAFIEYDEFSVNRPENRLLKSTLEYLYRQSRSLKNKSDIKTLLTAFSEIQASENPIADFNKIVIDRNMKNYITSLQWCKVFLFNKSFTIFKGSEIAMALLYPMEVLFESYIAAQINKYLDKQRFIFTAQDKAHHLFDYPKRKFLMKPDIVILDKTNGHNYVLDTKWKVLSELYHNYGISQGDMYQMYAYQKKYESKNVTLLYPFTEKVSSVENIDFISIDGSIVKVRFIDLLDIKNSINDIIKEIN